MPKLHLTKRSISALPPLAKGQVLYRDTLLLGFGLRVGSRSQVFCAEGQVQRKTVRVTIGKFGIITPEAARKKALKLLGEMAEGDQLRLLIQGPDFETGETAELTLMVNAEGASAAERLTNTGLLLLPEDGVTRLDEPMFGSEAAEALIDFDFYTDEPVTLASIQVPQDRMPAQVFYLPALLLLGVVIMLQRRRQTQPAF